MSFNKIPLLLLSILLCIFSCDKKEQKPDFPVLFTGEITDVSKDGAVFSASFKNIDSDRLTDFGFVWGTNENLTIDSPYKYSLSLEPNKEFYSYRNTTSLLPETVYFVMSFVKYERTVFYGKAISFLSLGARPPEILSITPASAYFGDTVKINIGEAIPVTAPIKVFFNKEEVKITGIKDSSILVIVPDFKESDSYFIDGKTSVLFNRFSISSNQYNGFTIKTAEIYSFEPESVQTFNLLTITGKGFLPNSTEVIIAGEKCKISEIDNRKIICRAPISFEDIEDSLTINIHGKISKTGKIKILAPLIKKHFPDSIFSNGNLSFTGRNLANEQLSIKIDNKTANILYRSDDEITVEVVGRLCGIGASVEMQIEDSIKKYIDKLPILQPSGFEIKPGYDGNYQRNVSIKGNYLPETLPSVYLNNSYYSYAYFSYNKKDKSELKLYNLEEFPMPNGFISLKASFCDSTIIYLDSVYSIPAPKIDKYDPVINNFSVNKIYGKNFNQIAQTNLIYIDDIVFPQQTAQNDSTLLFFPFDKLSEGEHTMHVTTNEQPSNKVTINFQKLWEKASANQDYFGSVPKGFILGDFLYTCNNDDGNYLNFYSYNLKSKIWESKANKPSPLGAFVTDNLYGYLYCANRLFRYTPQTNSWELLSENSFGQLSSDYWKVNSVYYAGKLFFFTGCEANEIYIYDIKANSWSNLGFELDYNFWPAKSTITVVDDKVYLLDGENYMTFDFITEKYSLVKKLPGHVYNNFSFQNGFNYNGDIYTYQGDHFLKFTPGNNMESSKIYGPSAGAGNCILRQGNMAYLVISDGVWEFDLSKQ
jgi:hypothetical protein